MLRPSESSLSEHKDKALERSVIHSLNVYQRYKIARDISQSDFLGHRGWVIKHQSLMIYNTKLTVLLKQTRQNPLEPTKKVRNYWTNYIELFYFISRCHKRKERLAHKNRICKNLLMIQAYCINVNQTNQIRQHTHTYTHYVHKEQKTNYILTLSNSSIPLL
jgi:hypothetical protein